MNYLAIRVYQRKYCCWPAFSVMSLLCLCCNADTVSEDIHKEPDQCKTYCIFSTDNMLTDKLIFVSGADKPDVVNRVT